MIINNLNLLLENVSIYGGYIPNNNPLTAETIEYSIIKLSKKNYILEKSKQTDEYENGRIEESFFTTAPELNFTDVSTAHPNSDAINYVQSEGIVNGYSDETFKPDQTINRAEFTKIIIGSKYSTDEIYACTPNQTFEDVDPFQVPWIYQYSCMARNEGIINGYSDGTFKPFQNISFIEAAKIIANTFGYEILENDIWYKPFVEKLAIEKAIPISIDSFQKDITRGEMAEMVYRLKAGVTNKETNSYDDLNEGNASNRFWKIHSKDFTISKNDNDYLRDAPGEWFSVCLVPDSNLCTNVIQTNDSYIDWIVEHYKYNSRNPISNDAMIQFKESMMSKETRHIKTDRQQWEWKETWSC